MPRWPELRVFSTEGIEIGGGKQAKRTRIPAEISVGSQLIVGGSANPVVGGIVGSVWSFPVERRHGGRRWGSSSELV